MERRHLRRDQHVAERQIDLFELLKPNLKRCLGNAESSPCLLTSSKSTMQVPRTIRGAEGRQAVGKV
jgi:hypothetical protein